ncbi:unnamed protein product [Ilex paraguariensis]|uniref:Serpin domain-containing protein n=1 Tax=Ilex paraguariensis TaxID=185542 RepID=A0ABC8UAA0_9AQUA
MKEMGLTLPFSETCTELTEMAHLPIGVPFHISQIIQKTFIEIDEEGTEAAAGTFTTELYSIPVKMILAINSFSEEI